MSEKIPPIPQPIPELQSLTATVLALKQAVELLAGQRGEGSLAAVTRTTLPQRLRELGVTL